MGSVCDELVLGTMMLLVFVGINLVKNLDNAVYSVREVSTDIW